MRGFYWICADQNKTQNAFEIRSVVPGVKHADRRRYTTSALRAHLHALYTNNPRSIGSRQHYSVFWRTYAGSLYCSITECGNKTQLHWVPSRWLCISPSLFSRKKLLLFIPPVCPFHRNACGRHQEVDKKDILAKRASAGAFLLHHLWTASWK
jgi:hypothetical protein